MKISYDPENFSGAGRYMATIKHTAETSSHRKWLEQATAKMFADKGAPVREFVILQRGIGFFWEEIGYTSGPFFQTEVVSNGLPDLIAVTYWIAADVIK